MRSDQAMSEMRGYPHVISVWKRLIFDHPWAEVRTEMDTNMGSFGSFDCYVWRPPEGKVREALSPQTFQRMLDFDLITLSKSFLGLGAIPCKIYVQNPRVEYGSSVMLGRTCYKQN